jgi:prepilin-type processing-associated H-X9-DG protein
MKRFRVFLSLIVAAGAVFFAVRHHSLRQLKSEQEQLRQQSEASANPEALTARTNDAPGALANAGLSAAERSELLRLRGEIGVLRRDLQSVQSPSRMIMLREKEPWKAANGRWKRTYAFADGHVEMAASDTPDFSEWENQKQNAP